MTVALLTARILAPGEDPGMLQVTSGPTTLLLPLLWLLAAVGLAAWRLGSRSGDWHGGLVETALLLSAWLVFVAAEMAGYKHPARIIAWDWLTLFVVVCLVRQLAVSPGDRQALFAVFLAGAGALSAQAVYQAAIRVPASATFAQPGPFAAWLALFLPGLVAAAFGCRPGRAPAWQTVLSEVFGVLSVIAFIAAVASIFSASDGAPPLPELSGATGRMILAHPLGVGPGNFSRAFPSFQPPSGGTLVADPHNFVLEIAATCGVATLLAVLAALGAFFVKAVRWLRKPSEAADAVAAEPGPNEHARWEFYAGGMCGLVLGFIIRQTTGDHTPDDILNEGFAACARCLVWLTAFVLFERVRWSGRVRVAALTAGVGALLLMLLANPGAGLPSVAVPLWAAVALVLNESPQRDYPRINPLALTRILPFFAVAAVALLYFLVVFVPVTSSSEKVQEAVQAGEAYRQAVKGKNPLAFAERLNKTVLAPLQEAVKEEPDDVRVKLLLAQWSGELWSIYPAGNLDMQMATAAVAWAKQAEQLDPQGRDGYEADYRLRMGFGRRLELVYQRRRAYSLPLLGAALGPAYRLVLNETRWPHPLGRGALEKLRDEQDPNEPAYQYLQAAAALEKYLPNDPNDAVLRFRLSEALFKAWEDDACRGQAAEALRIDAAASRPPLTDEQRQKLNAWKNLPPPKGYAPSRIQIDPALKARHLRPQRQGRIAVIAKRLGFVAEAGVAVAERRSVLGKAAADGDPILDGLHEAVLRGKR